METEEQNQPPKNSYELKQEEKVRENEKRDSEKKTRRLAGRFGSYIFFAGILALIVWAVFYYMRGKIPQGLDQSRAVEIQSRDHIAVGAEHLVYNSNPPVGGWHYGQTARRNFYDEKIPDEYIIHNLEHGDVWIAYHPRISTDAKKKLKRFLYSRVIITARPENNFDISLVAWGRVDGFNLEDGEFPKERIDDFIKRYKNKGTEKVPLDQQNSFN